jgi:hypothetical protein
MNGGVQNVNLLSIPQGSGFISDMNVFWTHVATEPTWPDSSL